MYAVARVARGITQTFVVVRPENYALIRRMGGEIVKRDMTEVQARIEAKHRNLAR